MDRNTASQKLTFFAFTPADGLPKTGDAANITMYVQKDDGSVTALTDTSAAEVDATNAKGMYSVDLTQGETDAIKAVFTGKSSTSGVEIVPQVIYTQPAGGSTLTIANNAVAANVTRYGGTAGTFSSGRPEVNATHWGGTAVASALVRGNLIQIAGSAVNTSSAQLGVNVVNVRGSGATGLSNLNGDYLANAAVPVYQFTAAAQADIELQATEALQALGYNAALAALINSLTIGGGNDTVGTTGNDTTHLHLPDMAGFADDALNDCLIVLYDASGFKRYAAYISDWVQSTALATLDTTLPITPEASTDTYFVYSLKRDARTGIATACRDISNASAAAGSIGDDVHTGMLAAAAASGYAESAVNKLGTGWTGTGVNNVLGAFKALLSKTASTPSDIGGTFDPAADSTEAIRDRGDAAWTTATSVTVSDKTGFKLASDGLDTVLVESSISVGAGLTNDSGTQLTSINARQAMALIASACGAVLAGAAGTNVTMKPAGKPAGNTRIDATVTADGNRTAVNLKVPD